jgi:hypothetical protein
LHSQVFSQRKDLGAQAGERCLRRQGALEAGFTSSGQLKRPFETQSGKARSPHMVRRAAGPLAEQLVMTRALKLLGYILVTIYFVADLAFESVARPLSAWIGRLQILRPINAWIAGLRPYPALALFSIPVVILEPVKPIGAFLVSAGHVLEGILTIAIGEILKITLVERLFKLTRDRLMQIPLFAILFGYWIRIREWIMSSEIWCWMRSQKERLKSLFGRAIAGLRRRRLNTIWPPKPHVATARVALEIQARAEVKAGKLSIEMAERGERAKAGG